MPPFDKYKTIGHAPCVCGSVVLVLRRPSDTFALCPACGIEYNHEAVRQRADYQPGLPTAAMKGTIKITV